MAIENYKDGDLYIAQKAKEYADTKNKESFDLLFKLFNPYENMWADAPFETIAAALDANDAGYININDYIKVGDTRTVHLSAMEATGVGESHVEQDVEIVIVSKGRYDTGMYIINLENGNTPHFVIGLKNGLANNTNPERGYINSTNTNEGGWTSSARRAWCNNVFADAVPSGLKAMMKPTKVYTSRGYLSTAVGYTIDTWFLPSEWEVFNRKINAAAREGNMFEYYNGTGLIKCAGADGSAAAWFLRSPYASNITYFCGVGQSGTSFYQPAASPLLIAPHGCI